MELYIYIDTWIFQVCKTCAEIHMKNRPISADIWHIHLKSVENPLDPLLVGGVINPNFTSQKTVAWGLELLTTKIMVFSKVNYSFNLVGGWTTHLNDIIQIGSSLQGSGWKWKINWNHLGPSHDVGGIVAIIWVENCPTIFAYIPGLPGFLQHY